MHLATVNTDARSFWTAQLPFCKLYGYYLAVVAIYTLFSLSRMLARLHSLKKAATENHESRRHPLAALQDKCDNLRQLTLFSVLLFGLVFFLQIPANFKSLVDSSLTGWDFIFHSLAIYFDFAAGVFLILLILHVAQWIISAQFRRLTLPH